MNSSDIAVIESFGVSRETLERLKIYAELLHKWQAKMNLVSNSTLHEIWLRHFADSLQLLKYRKDAKIWLDLGSGAGFPGLPIAIHFASGDKGGFVHLIERDSKKCAFMREVARETGAAAHIHHGEITTIVKDLGEIDLVVSRAVASLSTLLGWASPLLNGGAVALFLKGQDMDKELTADTIFSNFDIRILKSQIGSDGNIVRVRLKSGTCDRIDGSNCG